MTHYGRAYNEGDDKEKLMYYNSMCWKSLL